MLFEPGLVFVVANVIAIDVVVVIHVIVVFCPLLLCSLFLVTVVSCDRADQLILLRSLAFLIFYNDTKLQWVIAYIYAWFTDEEASSSPESFSLVFSLLSV